LNEIELLKSLRGDEKVIRLDDEETTRGTSGRPKAIFVVRTELEIRAAFLIDR
jgi:hypothetical protein